MVDRLIVRPGAERRLTESIERALAFAEDVVIINTLGGGDRLFSRRLACVDCGINMPELTPRVFSFNSPHGACRDCQGLGAVEDFDPARVVPDTTKSLADGAIDPWARSDRKLVGDVLNKLSRHFEIDLDIPFERLPRRRRELLLYGPTDGSRRSGRQTRKGTRRGPAPDPFGRDFEGIIPNLRRRYETGTWTQQEALEAYRALRSCPACKGERLRPESRAVRVKGRTLSDYVNLPIFEAQKVFEVIEVTEREALVADRVLREFGIACTS